MGNINKIFKRLAQSLDMPTSIERMPATTPFVWSDAQNSPEFYGRRKVPFIKHYIPDSSAVDDLEQKSDPKILSIQQLMSSSPLGISYSGPKDGIINPQLIQSLQNLESKITNQYDINVIGKITSGGKITTTTDSIQKLLQKVKPTKEEIQTIKPEIQNSLTKSFQIYLNKIGKYSGPIDGKINNDLISSIKEIEKYLAKQTNNSALIGSIWNGKNILTTPDDISEALNLLQTQKKITTSSNNILSFLKR